jgi:very-short-patch-repair endonuclease
MSLPEVLLWQRLKGSPGGIAFRKQHPISGYRADFYCASAKLIIEVDGAAHDMGDRPQRDLARTVELERQGYQIVRIPAADVLRNADESAASIVIYAANPLHHSPAASGPPPRAGEDRETR